MSFGRPRWGSKLIVPQRHVRDGARTSRIASPCRIGALPAIGKEGHAAALGRLWRAFLHGEPACIGREFGRYTSSFDGAAAIAPSGEAAVQGASQSA
jgi:hypothetical protein